jgi:hypothetical protein
MRKDTYPLTLLMIRDRMVLISNNEPSALFRESSEKVREDFSDFLWPMSLVNDKGLRARVCPLLGSAAASNNSQGWYE